MGGPVARVAAITKVDINALWHTLIPLQVVGFVIVLLFAVLMGVLEKRRGVGLDVFAAATCIAAATLQVDPKVQALKRPKLVWFNALLTLGVISLFNMDLNSRTSILTIAVRNFLQKRSCRVWSKTIITTVMLFAFALLPLTAAAEKSVEPSTGVKVEKSSMLYAYVGSRITKERNSRGEGINVYRVDSVTGNWTHVELVKTSQENPSFLALDRGQKYLYAVHGDFSEVSAFEIDKQTGKLTFLNQQSTNGKNPVYLVTDPSNKFMVVANYATGSLVSLPINPDGSLAPIVDQAQLPGKTGPHRAQQGSSHPHQVMFDPAQKFLLVPDKGLDKELPLRLMRKMASLFRENLRLLLPVKAQVPAYNSSPQ